MLEQLIVSVDPSWNESKPSNVKRPKHHDGLIRLTDLIKDAPKKAKPKEQRAQRKRPLWHLKQLKNRVLESYKRNEALLKEVLSWKPYQAKSTQSNAYYKPPALADMHDKRKEQVTVEEATEYQRNAALHASALRSLAKPVFLEDQKRYELWKATTPGAELLSFVLYERGLSA